MKESLRSEEHYLRNENAKMASFLSKSENNTGNVAELIKTPDQLSEQILDITSSMKAHDDCLDLLQGKFNSEEISFEEFIKNLRKIEEEKFEEKVLLAKCLSVAH